MKEQDIDKLFRDALSNRETSPRPGLWDKIADQLDGEQKVVSMATAGKRKLGWIKYAAAACLLISIGIGYYTLQHQEPAIAKNTIVQKIEKPAIQHESILDIADKNKRVAQIDNGTIEINSTKTFSTKQTLVSHKPDQELAVKKAVELHKDLAVVENTQQQDHREEIQEFVAMEKELTQAVAVVLDEPTKEMPTVSVTEVDPVKPLINPFEEEEESMIAGRVRQATNTLINGLFNRDIDNVLNIGGKEVKINSDDEGSLSIDVSNLFARTRIKKRK